MKWSALWGGLGVLLGSGGFAGCVYDPDCGICDPHQLILESISGSNYAGKKIHLLNPPCQGEACPAPFDRGSYFVEEIGPCVTSDEALASPRGAEEYCKLSPLVTGRGIEFIFNNLLQPTSVELVRRRPDNPQLYEVYDWKTQVMHIEGPITRFNGDYHVGASGDPDQITRSVNLSCIDNLRDQGRSFSHLDYADPDRNPCNTVDPSTGQPMKLRVEGSWTSARGQWDSRALGEASAQTCSNPESGPDTCCSECDLMLGTQVAKYGVLSTVEPGSGAVLEGAALLRRDNQRRPSNGTALECDVDGDPLVDCRGFMLAVDRSSETLRYDYHWSCDPNEGVGCQPETFKVPKFDQLRQTHPDERPAWAEVRTVSCQSSLECLDSSRASQPGATICVGHDEEGRSCSLDSERPGCTHGYCIAPWFVTCRAQPDTTGAAGYCVDTRFSDAGAPACLRSTAQFSVCEADGLGCRTAEVDSRLAYCDANEDDRYIAQECCQSSLGAVPADNGEFRCDPVMQDKLRAPARADRNRFLPDQSRRCLCTDLEDATPECRSVVAATCVDETGRVRPEREAEYAVKFVTRRGGVIYDPAVKGIEWRPADWGAVPRAGLERCAQDRGLITRRTVNDSWLAHGSVDRSAENYEDFDRAMCSGQRYTIVFQTPDEGEAVVDKRGNTLRGRTNYTMQTPQFHVVPQSGAPGDNLRIGACDDFSLRFSNKYDLSPENLAKLQLWHIDERGEPISPRPGCGIGPVAGGRGCAATEADRLEEGECTPSCLTVDVAGFAEGTVRVQIDPTEFGAVLEPGQRYRLEAPGLETIEQMQDPQRYQAAFWDACGMPLVLGIEGDAQPEYVYEFSIDEPKCREDLDRDGLQFSCDNAQEVYNRDQSDVDHDGIGDVIDLCPVVASATANSADSDKDGIGNECDNCRQTVRQYNEGADALLVPYAMLTRNLPFQTDTDRDGIGDACDNCVTVANCQAYGPDNPYRVGDPIAYDDAGRCQRDDDFNLIGDACQAMMGDGAAGPVGFEDAHDFDQDGLANGVDACPRQPLDRRVECEFDTDCPLHRSCERNFPDDPMGVCDHVDTDADGLGDICDSCPSVSNPLQLFDGIEQQGDPDGDFIGVECELHPSCEVRTAPRPLAFYPVSVSGYCCTVQLRENDDGTLTDRVTGRDVLDPYGVPVRQECSDAQQDQGQCRRLPRGLASTPGVLSLPAGCEAALQAEGFVEIDDHRPVTLSDLDGDSVALWDRMCLLAPRDQDHDGVGDICDLCDFAWDPENRPYVDAGGRLWPGQGEFCHGEFAPDIVCADDDPFDDPGGTGDFGESESGPTDTGQET